jgi:hypothetical protein
VRTRSSFFLLSFILSLSRFVTSLTLYVYLIRIAHVHVVPQAHMLVTLSYVYNQLHSCHATNTQVPLDRTHRHQPTPISVLDALHDNPLLDILDQDMLLLIGCSDFDALTCGTLHPRGQLRSHDLLVRLQRLLGSEDLEDTKLGGIRGRGGG